MRTVLKKRYYCDFCKKSGARGPDMARHELYCIRNPNRGCRMCDAGELAQEPIPVLLAALKRGGLAGLERAASHCPACILAALVQDRINDPITFTPDGPNREYIEFDYKAACARFWGDVNEAERSWSNRG